MTPRFVRVAIQSLRYTREGYGDMADCSAFLTGLRRPPLGGLEFEGHGKGNRAPGCAGGDQTAQPIRVTPGGRTRMLKLVKR